MELELYTTRSFEQIKERGVVRRGDETAGDVRGSVQPGRYEVKSNEEGKVIFTTMVIYVFDLSKKLNFRSTYSDQILISGQWLTVVGVLDWSKPVCDEAHYVYLLSEDQDGSQ